jgi:hypothetical protein
MAKGKRPPPQPIPSLDDLFGQADLPSQPTPPPVPINVPDRPAMPAMDLDHARRLITELAVRRAEALAIYEPLPNQQAFHASLAPERLLRGSIRAGKTLPASVEIARALTGQDPYGKWPQTDGVFYMVAPDENHLADVIYPKLFKAGAFKMIRDLKTKLWRSYRPWDPADVEREKEAKRSPPLVPPRFVKDTAWRNKKRGVPSSVIMKNGWKINFFVEKGEPQRGVDLDGVWFDEEIKGGGWYSEMSGRLLDRKGRFIWSAAPQTGTQQLYELHRRAVDQLDLPPALRSIEEFEILLKENPHIDNRQKKLLAEKLTEDEIRILIDGEYAILSYLVYPMFSKTHHGIMSFEIPPTWTHYAIIDPGHQICAVLFMVAPPPDHPLGKHRIAYDELYIKQCSADLFAEAAAPKIAGRNFEEFIIDRKMTRQADVGSGTGIEVQYMAALQKYDLKCNATGHGFSWGSPDVRGRLSSSKSWLEMKKDGRPIFLYFKDVLRFFVWEMERYHNKAKKVGSREILTDEPYRTNDHLMAGLQYAAAHGCEYVPPPDGTAAKSGALMLFERWQAEATRKAGGQYIRLGPGTQE